MSKIWKYMAAVALLFIGLGAFAQDKTQAYYSTHDSEILPDAQTAFREGNYDRTVELCKWHYIFIGDKRADELRDKAEQCAKLTTEMNAFVSSGQLDLSQERAQAILALNPDDKKAQEFASRGIINGHEWVDLGLGVKWATCNVGASLPSDPGDYFAWGETSPKSEYSWANYSFRETGDAAKNVMFNKYNDLSDRGTKDCKYQLDFSDDAARANWGGTWRMPTHEEQTALVTRCDWTWTTQDGQQGYKVTGKNGNSIFLPAMGYRSNNVSWAKGNNLTAAKAGFYWSSSLVAGYPNDAYYLRISSDRVVDSLFEHIRYAGCLVRPVSE